MLLLRDSLTMRMAARPLSLHPNFCMRTILTTWVLGVQWNGPHSRIAQLPPQATSDPNHTMDHPGAIPADISALYGAGDGNQPSSRVDLPV